MERILLMDARNYDQSLPEILRVAVRGIIFVDGKLLFAGDKAGELKIPGGGIEEGEDDVQALVREVREETGYTVIPESLREFGYIEEKRKSLNEEMIWHQFSRIYFCDVEPMRGDTSFEDNEKKYGLHFVACTLDEAIEANRKMLDKQGELIWNKREYNTLLLLKEYLEKSEKAQTS